MRDDAALVLFSGGQDSATCLAWALDRFAHVETLGFDYGQRHRVELDCRAGFRDALPGIEPGWAARLGPDHTLRLDALGEVSDTALTRDAEIRMGAEGLPNTFVPGRNLLFLTFAAALAYRRGLQAHRRRHVRDGLFRLPGLPRRHHQGAAGGAEPRHGAPLRAGNPADVAVQGRHLAAGGTARRRRTWWRRWSSTPIPATWATGPTAIPGASAAAPARPANCAPRAGRISWRRDYDPDPPRRGRARPDRLRPVHPRRQLADRQCRHRLRPERTVPGAGRAGADGAVGRADDRPRAGAAGPGAAAARRRLLGRGGAGGCGAVGLPRAAGAGAGLGRRLPAQRIRRPRRLYPAAEAPPGAGGGRRAARSGWWWTAWCSSTSPSAASISWPARWSARRGWCWPPCPSCICCAGATNGSASSRPDAAGGH